jgi:hypothetical protein
VSAGSELEQALTPLRRAPGTYQAPSEPQRAQWKDWFAHLLTSAVAETLPSRAAPEGFAGRFVDGGAIWLVAEQGATKTGAGAYAIRPRAKNDVVIQAPHTFFDQGTLPLALTLFQTLDARVLMINTLHRGGAANQDEVDDERIERARSGKEDADLAHTTDSYYQVAHSLFGAEWPRTRFIQLHGFRDEKVPGVSVIVSGAGTQFDPLPVARALNDVFGAGTARVYPDEVKKLGGTTNAQARACKEAGWSFLHLEIAASLRQRMERQASLREQFAQALAQAMLLR